VRRCAGGLLYGRSIRFTPGFPLRLKNEGCSSGMTVGRGREHGYWAGCGFLAPLTPVLPECSFLASSLSLLNRHTSWQMCYFCITRTI